MSRPRRLRWFRIARWSAISPPSQAPVSGFAVPLDAAKGRFARTPVHISFLQRHPPRSRAAGGLETNSRPARPSSGRCGRLVDADRASPPPAHAQQPRPRSRNRRWLPRRLDALPPSPEPRARGTRIDSPADHPVLAPVQQHVDEAVAHLPRRPQRSAVVALCPHAAPTAEPPVDRLRQADAEPLHPPSERPRPSAPTRRCTWFAWTE